MPGEISRAFDGPPPGVPYVPSWLYSKGPRMCSCGHHEGFHGGDGACLLVSECGCSGLPAESLTPLEEM